MTLIINDGNIIIFRVACRCLWDSDTDNYAQDIFMNVSSVFIAHLHLSLKNTIISTKVEEENGD